MKTSKKLSGGEVVARRPLDVSVAGESGVFEQRHRTARRDARQVQLEHLDRDDVVRTGVERVARPTTIGPVRLSETNPKGGLISSTST